LRTRFACKVRRYYSTQHCWLRARFRCHAKRRDGEDFVIAFQPEDIVVFRHSEARARQFINDCHTFLLAKETWAERADEHGWNDLELFGCCRRPLERLGNAGLLWAVNGGRLVELRRDWAVIERASDRSRHVHHRERPKAADITLHWIGLR
jgi:hypothetical protein